MRNAANFLFFQAFWFAAVAGAARGWLWAGPAACFLFLLMHLRMVPAQRMRELAYVLTVGALGTTVDTGMKALGAIAYPAAETWTSPLVPPYIASLWVAFAMLPRFSLGWLSGKPLLGALLGGVGGPLSFYAGTRFGVVGLGEVPALSWALLALEYALATPLMLHFAHRE